MPLSARAVLYLHKPVNVSRHYYLDEWIGEICTTVNGKRAFRPGVGWK